MIESNIELLIFYIMYIFIYFICYKIILYYYKYGSDINGPDQPKFVSNPLNKWVNESESLTDERIKFSIQIQ